MGWERKRGKLMELNRLLRGATDTSYVEPEDPPSDLHDGPLRDHARRGHASCPPVRPRGSSERLPTP